MGDDGHNRPCWWGGDFAMVLVGGATVGHLKIGRGHMPQKRNFVVAMTVSNVGGK